MLHTSTNSAHASLACAIALVRCPPQRSMQCDFQGLDSMQYLKLRCNTAITPTSTALRATTDADRAYMMSIFASTGISRAAARLCWGLQAQAVW